MHIPQLTIPSLKSPLLMRVQIPHTYIIDDHIVDEGIAIDTDLHVELAGVSGDGRVVVLVRDVVFF